MSKHVEKTIEAINSNPAPRDIDWTTFIKMWESIADDVKQESGDRLAVTMNGHREVFHRPHDGRVGIEDVHRARAFMKKTPDLKGSGPAYGVTIDAKGAHLYAFNLDAVGVEDTTKHERDHDPRAHHLRTVERKSGRDDEADLKGFFTELAADLDQAFDGGRFVVLGHGKGKADVAGQFVEHCTAHQKNVANRIIDVVDIDLSAVNAGDIENAVINASKA